MRDEGCGRSAVQLPGAMAEWGIVQRQGGVSRALGAEVRSSQQWSAVLSEQSRTSYELDELLMLAAEAPRDTQILSWKTAGERVEM